MINALKSTPPVARYAIVRIYRGEAFFIPMAAMVARNGYTISAIHGNDSPNTTE